MLFTSMIFIWIFLPVVLVGNFLLQKAGGNKAANILLVIASIFFYAWGEPVYVLLMIFSIFINWFAGLMLSKTKQHKKTILVLAIVVNLALIGFFKYAGMIVLTVNQLTGASFPMPEIALPIGISFFTFQALSYVVDVYRKECETQKNILKVALYVSFFPQLIAGPIVKYKDIEEQIDTRTVSACQVAQGIRRFSYGFAKKILISNILASVADTIYALDLTEVTCPMAWIASFMYTFQIYYDFSGYSDMAIGLGKMFGFEFKENFNYPYISLSIREFWRRWHISLSSWFRDYVYIPLGGSRKGKLLTYKNLLVVFFLTGLWHGASWNFVFWGLFHGVFIIIERIGFDKFLNRHRIFAWIYTFFLANIGWVFFKLENIKDAFAHIGRMFQPWADIQNTHVLREYVNIHAIFILICAVVGMGLIQKLWKTGLARKWKYSVPEIVFCAVLMVLSLASLASNTYNPFIYFRF